MAQATAVKPPTPYYGVIRPLRSSTVKAAAVLYVKQLDRMSSFYQRCFGMVAAERAADYHVLESDAWTLSLRAVSQEIAGTIHLSTPPERRADTPIKLAFDVSNTEVLKALVAELGGPVDPTTTEWDFRGFRHCDAIDPEGNVIQLREPLTPQPPEVAARHCTERATT
jgi:predicted enzyme related to lactoylglutathione lyase